MSSAQPIQPTRRLVNKNKEIRCHVKVRAGTLIPTYGCVRAGAGAHVVVRDARKHCDSQERYGRHLRPDWGPRHWREQAGALHHHVTVPGKTATIIDVKKRSNKN